MKHKRIVQTVFSVSGVIIIGKLFGFAKQIFIAAQFGTTMETDIVSLAEGFVANTQYLLVQVLLTSFTAVYIHTESEDEYKARMFSGDTIKVFTLFAALLSTVIILASDSIARIIAPSYSVEASEKLADYLRIFAPLLIVFVCIALFHSLLNSNKRFIPGEFVSINQSIITIAVVALLATRIGVDTLVISLFAYTIFNAIFLWIFSHKFITLHCNNPFRNPYVKKLIRMVLPLLLTYSAIYINQQVDKILVSRLEAGTVTAMGYAAVLSNLVNTFIVTFCSILFTYVTSSIAKGDDEKAVSLSVNVTLLLITAFLPISILTVMGANDIVTIVFARGAFNYESIFPAAQALKGYGFIFVPTVLSEVYSRVLYGYQDSKSPMLSSLVSIAVNIALSIILCRNHGVFGVTLASSIAVCVCGALNLIRTKKRCKFIDIKFLLYRTPLLVIGGVVCWITAREVMGTMAEMSALFRFILASLAGLTTYLIIVSPMLYRLYIKKKEFPV